MYWRPVAAVAYLAAMETTFPGSVIPVPEPALTPDEIVERAAAMREDLRERQAETEERTFYAPEIHQAFADAGFYRILQPRRFGGYEFDIETYYRVVIELSRGCPSTGWCFCLGGAHVLQLAAYFGEEAQAAIFGADGHFVAASRDLPAGTATPVDGGYRIEGTWNYCSGAPYSTHFIARAKLAGPDGEVPDEPRLALVAIARDDWEMLDDWHGILGLRGTGSHSIRVPGAVVPESWVVTDDPFDLAEGHAAPLRVHPNPMYNRQHINFFHGEIAAIMTGVAMAAVDEYERIVLTNRTYDPLPPGPRWAAPDYQRPLGLGSAKAQAAREITLGTARRHLELCHREADGGGAYRFDEDLLHESMQGQAAVTAFEAIEMLVRMSGSSHAVREGQRMERYMRDALVYRSHQQGANIEMMATVFGRSRLEHLRGD
jgi:3-hydroxy-9,10-secoandrosta-1,3,5(10)-triene-9,17-dione monooxygenase